LAEKGKYTERLARTLDFEAGVVIIGNIEKEKTANFRKIFSFFAGRSIIL